MNFFVPKFFLVVFSICTIHTLNAQVTAPFTTTQTTVCEGVGVGFTNTSTSSNPVVSCNWDFGNMLQSSSCGNAGIIYTSPGSYNVCLTITDNMNNSDVACTTITVLPAPPVEFVATPVSGCTPFNITLQDTTNTTQPNWSWTWIISSDSTFCDAAVLDTIKRFDVNPFNYTVQNAGNYHVRLIVKNAVNCSADVTKFNYIIASPPPTADFTETIQVDCDSFTNVLFTNASQNCKDGVAYLWDFGDGSMTDTSTNPTHEYFGFGDFDITLIINNTTSGCADTLIKTITIPANDTANFNMNKTDGCLNENIQFTDLSSGNSVSWLWDFGDGNTSTAKNPTHNYDSVGCFIVTLTVTIDSCVRTFTHPTCITIHPDPVISYQTVGNDFSCSTPYAVSFTSNLPTGVTPSWNFGDGNISTDIHPTNNYINNGNFIVSLTGTDLFGCQATVSTDTIVIETLDVLFTADTLSGCVPISIQFTDTSFSQSPITSWQWRFVDDQTGQTFTSTDTTPNINFNVSGVYDAILTVTNSLGCVDSLVKTDYITIGALPNLSFFATDSVLCYNQNVTFLNYSDSSATNWRWEFGDGNFVQNQFSPNYSYSQLGTFSVTVSADINGCADTLTKVDYIEVQPPIANFSGAATCQNPLDVQFNNFSIGAASYEWNFGDGSVISTATTPLHSYATTGIYNVTLKAFHANGCVDSITRSINLNHPVADFGWVATQLSDGCYRGGVIIVLTNNSQNAQSCRWEIPQATYVSNTNQNQCVPLIQFDTAGIFDITLIVFGQNGCNDTLTQQICISDVIPGGGIGSSGNSGNGGFGGWSWGYGGFGYTLGGGGTGYGGIIFGDTTVSIIEGTSFTQFSQFNYITGCVPLTVDFKDSSTVFPDTTTLTYLWNFGDGTTSTLQNPTHTYWTPTNGSVYMVSLRVTTSTGIVRTDTLNTFIRPTKPLVTYFASKDSACIGETVDFINQSEGLDLSYHWDFGTTNAGDTAITRDASFAFDTAGLYNVCLTVTDFNGCDSTFCRTISILQPTADFVPDITSSNCDTLTVNFMNTSTDADSFLWNFGVLGTDTTLHPTVTFGDPGNYTVCLTAVNSIGCIETKCDTNLISVNGPVLDTYSFSPQATCIPAAIEFVAAGTNINTYKWIPQAGDTLTKMTGLDTDTTIFTYTTVDTFYPQLIVEDSLGCPRQVFLDSVVTTNPQAIFTLDTLAGCAPVNIVANATASTFAQSYQWRATGGTIFNGSSANPTIRFSSAGQYDSIRLVITDFTGCQDTFYLTDTVTVSEAFAGFAMDTTTGCIPLTINFTDTSSTFADSIVSYSWNFGDAFTTMDTSSQKNSTYTYNNVPNNHGTNTVRLTITTQNGCSDVITQTVRPTFPNVFFTLDTFVCTGQTVNFNNQSSGVNIGYAWNFGDGNTSTLQNPTHSYATEGVFTVCLTVTDINGCDSTYCDSVRVADPVANFIAPTPFIACPPDTVCFTDLSLNAVAWEWDFGDQTLPSTEQNPCHVYTDPGEYTVTLTVTSLSGCQHTTTQFNYINVSGPYAEFTYTPLDSCTDMTVQICSDTLNNVDLIFYTTGDGFLEFYNNVSASDTFCFDYIYKNRGTYQPTIQIQDGSGCPRNILGPTIQVSDPEPIFTLSQNSLCNPLTVTTTNSSIDANGYEWIAIGGTISPNASATTPSISYNTAGTYTVSLVVTDRNGCKDTASQTVVVADVMPSATASTNLGCRALTVQFTDNSTSYPDTITSWLWNFGDGNTSNIPSPTHIYTQNGTFTVTLTITNTQGCSRTITVDQITVTFPSIGFSPSRTFVCTGQAINFANQSSGANITTIWNFGDGNSSAVFSPTHTYTTEGTYQVCLTVEDENNCDTTICQFILVADPKAEFTADTTYSTCYDSTFQFTDLSQNAVAWEWDFGDGTPIVTQQNPSHTYSQTGIYTVCLIVSSASGCRDTICKNQYITVDGPTGTFAFTPKNGCAPTDVLFTASGNDIKFYEWRVKENNTVITHENISGSDTLNYTYTTSGIFFPDLNLIDSTGCSLLLSADFVEIDTLQFDFTVSAVEICADSTLQFSHTIYSSSPIDSIRWNFVGANTTTSTIDNPVITYSNIGSYDVELTVYSRYCTKTIVKNNFITIHSNPVATFNPTPQNDCSPVFSSMNNATTITSDSITNWSWTFGDGNSSNLESPFNYYQNCGDFDILLTATSSFGCIDTAQRTLTIRCSPTSLFTLDTFACTGQIVNFTNLSTGNGLTYNWNFGDGNSSNAQTPTHAYINEGNYQVCLTVTDINGCDSTICNLVVIANPIAEFTADTTFRPCPPDSIQFTDLSSYAVGWSWDFGDGTTSDLQNPMHTFDTSGFYTICLTVTSASGCQNSICKNQYIEIGGAKGNFSFLPKSGCAPHTVRFEANGYNAHRYIWNFGDGNSQTHTTNQTIDTFEYTYTTAGEFYPTLRIEDTLGCGINITNDSVLVDTLQIDFYASDTLFCDNGTPNWTPHFYTNVPVDSFRWNFSSADISTSTALNPTSHYSTVGEWDVTLTVYTRFCTKTITKTNYIKIVDSPIAHFGHAPTLICDPNMAYFTDSSSVTNDNLVSWLWDFDDNNATDTNQNTAHLYQNSGTYNVSLTVTSNYGCATTTALPVIIEATPTSFFTSDTFACTGQTVNFTNLSTGNGLTYNWNFGDGNGSNLQTPTHSYVNEGNFIICLTVTDANGCDSMYCSTILIANPIAEFTADTTFRPCPPDSVQFTDLSSYAVGWSWDFGDGTTSDLQNPMHTFDTSGFYTICLTVTSASGCQNSICKNQYIEIGGAKGDFSFLPKSGCAPHTVRFEANGYNAHRYIWNFGDGNSQTYTTNQTIDTFEYTYTTAGEFYPTLRIEDTLGCGINITNDSVLVDTLQIDFYASDTLFCDHGTPNWTPHFYTNVPVDSFRWNFSGADISTSSTLNPTINYSTVGEWDVTLTVYTRFCTKTITKTNYIKIVDSPIANFSFSPTPSCDPEIVQFTDLSSVNNDNLVSWLWSFDDNNASSSAQNPTHFYFNEGLYNVSLTVTSNYGCITSVTLPVEIDSTPVSFFNPDTFACTGQQINFNNFSTGNGLTYHWEFGNGDVSSAQIPNYSYPLEGSYQICLTVTDLNGCDSMYCDSILIANPVAEFTEDTTFRPCPPDSIQFTDLSLNAVAWLWDFGDGQTSTLQHPNHTFDTSGFYTICLIVTSASGCQDTICKNQFIEIGGAKGSFTALPTLGCTPHPVFYEANGYNAHRYIWDFEDGNTQIHTTNQPLDTFTYTYDTAGTYVPILRIEDTLGCGVTYIGDTIQVDTLQIDFMASDTFSCGGDSITFTPYIVSSFSLDSVEWIFYGAQGGIVTTLNPTISYPTPGSYDVEMKIYSGHCFYSIRKNNYIQIAPVPDVLYQIATNPRCDDELVVFNNITQINGSNITQWEWRFGDNTTFNQAQPAPHNYPASGSYNVALTAITDLGCIDSMVQTVHVLPSPTATVIASGDTLCIGDTIILNGFGNGTYEWSPANSLDCSTCQNPVASPTTTTQYQLIVTSVGGCKDTTSVQVNVRPFARPTLELTADTTICQGDFLQLFAQTNANVTQIQWNTSSPGLSCYSSCANPIATPQVTTTYAVLVDGQDVCDASDSVTIQVIDPNSDILGDDIAICSGDSIPLQIAFGTNAVWSPTNGLTCVHCPNPIASPSQTTSYTVTAQVGSCIIQDTIEIEVVDLSQFSAGVDNSICPGDTIMLQGTSPVNGTYQWQPSTSLDNSTILTPIATPDSTTDYILTLNYGNCTASDTVTIEVNNKTELDIVESIEICEGEEVLIDVFGNADQVVWSPTNGIIQENPVIVSPTQTTIYTVIGTRNNCIADTALVTITVYPNPELEVFSFISRYFNEPEPTPLTIIEPVTNIAYTWTPNIAISCVECAEPFTTTDTTRMYYVDAVNDFGCITSDSILVTVIDSNSTNCASDFILMPTAFTPNGDGVNDKFYVRGNGIQKIEMFRIFNRWNELVFETQDITEGWDGTYLNKPVQPGLYFYYIEAICPLSNEMVRKTGEIMVLESR